MPPQSLLIAELYLKLSNNKQIFLGVRKKENSAACFQFCCQYVPKFTAGELHTIFPIKLVREKGIKYICEGLQSFIPGNLYTEFVGFSSSLTFILQKTYPIQYFGHTT